MDKVLILSWPDAILTLMSCIHRIHWRKCENLITWTWLVFTPYSPSIMRYWQAHYSGFLECEHHTGRFQSHVTLICLGYGYVSDLGFIKLNLIWFDLMMFISIRHTKYHEVYITYIRIFIIINPSKYIKYWIGPRFQHRI